MNYFFEALKYRNEPLFYFSVCCFALAFIFLLLTKISSVQLLGVNIWNKPFKFALSIGIYAISMAWYCYYLPSFNISFFNCTVIILFGFEVLYIALQALRGQKSHYNLSTPLYAMLFQLMGLSALIITIFTAYVGVLFFINNLPELPLAYLWGIRFAIIIFVIFSLVGGIMGARMSHSVGGEDGRDGIPLLNWSKKLGDLRIAHFIGMHALQVLPLLGFYILKNTIAIIILSSLYGLLALFSLIQALSGKPFHKL
ncbi:MAG: hypothetical protein WCJ61_13595 [Paludibacter sp.]